MKPVEAYLRNKRAPDGIDRDCIPCRHEKRAKFRTTESAQRMRTYYAKHAEKLEKQQEYQRANREKYREACRKWRAENPEKQKAAKVRWDKENPHVNAAAATRYYTRKKQRCPWWLTKKQHAEMLAFYAEARKRTLETGVKHSVDHIVPLHGDAVCGLHVPWNLQVLTAAENTRKFNRLDPAGGDSAFATGPGTL